jgi:hypothetical protein
MRKNIVLLLWLICCSISSLWAQESTSKWLFLAKIDNPKKIYNAFKEVKEFAPIFSKGESYLSEYYKTTRFRKLDSKYLEGKIFWGISADSDLSDSLIFWYEESGKTTCLGKFPSLIWALENLLLGENFKFRSRSIKKADLALPSEFSDFNNENSFQAKIFHNNISEEIKGKLIESLSGKNVIKLRKCKSNCRSLRKKIKAGAKLETLIEKISCPLGGKYSYEDGKVICSHKVSKPDLQKVNMGGVQKSAYNLLQSLEAFESLEIILNRTSGKLLLSAKISEKITTDENSVAASLKWFDSLKNCKIYPGSKAYLAMSTDLGSLMASMIPPHAHRRLPIMGDLPSGLFELNIFEFQRIFGFRLPLISLSSDFKTGDPQKIKAFLQQSGLLPEKVEISGIDVEAFKIPAMGPSFNSNAPDTNKIFWIQNDDKSCSITSAEGFAKEIIGLKNGEVTSVNIWSDINSPLKFAFAVRMATIGQTLLNWVNKCAFRAEIRKCSEAGKEWAKNNKEVYDQIKTEVPSGLQNCCPRKALIISDRSRHKVSCAIHNHRAFDKITSQFVKVVFSMDRWLRAYLEKAGNKFQLIIDIKKAEEAE